MNNYNEPKFKHDCKKCLFLGCKNDEDLYFCKTYEGCGTVIARYGDEPSEYASLPIFEDENIINMYKTKYPDLAITEAIKIIKEKGYIK